MSGIYTPYQPACFPSVILDEALVDAEEEELMRVYCEMDDKRRDLMSITSVCRRWNLSSLAHHGLWTNVWVTKRTSETELRTWLARSGSLLIDITFDFTDLLTRTPDIDAGNGLFGVPAFAEKITNMLAVVRQNTHRCRSLSLSMVSQHDAAAVLDYVSMMPAPIAMEQLRVTCVGDGHRQIRFSPMTRAFGGYTPALRRLRLQGVPLSFGCPSLTSDLAVLVLHSSSGTTLHWESLITSLIASRRLEVLALRNVQCRGTYTSHLLGMLVMPQLTRISLGRLTNGFATAFIALIDAPSLLDLSLDFHCAESSSIIRCLYAERITGGTFVTPVRRLTLVGVFTHDAVNLPLLKQLKSMISLELRNALAFFHTLLRFTIDLLDDAFELEPGVDVRSLDVLCPMLEIMTTAGLTGFSVGTFLVARIALQKAIKEVYIMSEDLMHNELATLSRFVDIAREFNG